MNVLEVRDLHVAYRRAHWGRRRDVSAVTAVDLAVCEGETVGLVGASGAGKTTLAKAVVHLVPAQRGRIIAGGFEVTSFGRRAPLEFRRAAQLVFQGSALNPAMTVDNLIAEPLRLHFRLSRRDVSVRTAALLDAVELPATYARRRPHELSVGQRQRVSIARALATEPALIVLDEPVSALDATTRRQVVTMLQDRQQESGVAYLLITHDILLARHLSRRIAVMHRGQVVEDGPADRIWDRPQHPFTQLLIASVPDPDPAAQLAAREQRRQLTLLHGGTDGGPASRAPPARGTPRRRSSRPSTGRR